MKGYMISTTTVTYAIKGRDILRKNGYKAKIEKSAVGNGNSGCGYAIIFFGELPKAEKILRKSGIEIIEIKEI